MPATAAARFSWPTDGWLATLPILPSPGPRRSAYRELISQGSAVLAVHHLLSGFDLRYVVRSSGGSQRCQYGTNGCISGPCCGSVRDAEVAQSAACVCAGFAARARSYELGAS